MPDLFVHFIDGALGNAFLLSFAIILCVFLLEDLTTVIVGILAAEGHIPVSLALCSLYVGIILGDMALYLIGSFARTHPRLARYLDHDYTATFRSWLEHKYPLVIFTGHFVPGLRFTAYIASGFFRRPLSVFIPSAVAGGLVLGTVLFSVSYWFGSVTSEWMRPARWIIALAFIVVLIYVGRKNLFVPRSQKAAGGDPMTSG